MSPAYKPVPARGSALNENVTIMRVSIPVAPGSSAVAEAAGFRAVIWPEPGTTLVGLDVEIV
jgi:hypothetical protein